MTKKIESQMQDYYARRVTEYERVYTKPERQSDLRMLGKMLEDAFPGERLLEIACGTGYWTKRIAKSAAAILATDSSREVIEVARQKDYGACCVELFEADAYLLDHVPTGHSAGFHGFWWSHIPLGRIHEFLSAFHEKTLPGSKVVMIDNAYVEGSSTPIAGKDAEGNTYQIRKLQDGSEHKVLKNFPTVEQMKRHLANDASDINIRFLDYFWVAEYRTKTKCK